MASTSNESNESSEGYHDQIVQYLLQKAILRNVKFELNLDHTQAGNFNGCSLFLEESKKWYFVQASSGSNPSKRLTEDVLFPVKDHERTNGEFSLFRIFRSYCDIEDYWSQGEGEKKFVLLTNKELNHSDVSECTEMGEIFKMSDSSKFHTLNTTNATLRQFATFTNREFEMIRKAIVALFIDGEMNQILKEYKTPLVPLFSLRYGKVKFAENFSEFNKDPRLRKLFNLLKEDFAKIETDIATVSVERTNMEDFLTISSRNLVLPPMVDRATVKQFFDSLVIGSAQPSGQDLLAETINEWRLWMLSWIKREDFELLTKHQLEQPCVSFKKAFEEWESGTVAARGRKCLNLEDGMRFLKYVEFELDYSLWNCTKKASEELSKIEQQFIRRRIVYNYQRFHSSGEQYLYLKDTELIDRLYSTFNDEKVFALEAELEPNKGLLEFVSKLGERSEFWACEGDCVNVLNYLKNVFNYDKTRSHIYEQPMLHVAVKHNSRKVLEILCDSKVNLEYRDHFGHKPLELACYYGHFEMVKALLSRGVKPADFYSRKQNTILHYAAEHGSVEIVQYLNVRCARIDVENNLGETPLFLAVRNNHLAVAELLLKTGANISHKDHYSAHILHAAAKSGNVNMVKLILDSASKQHLDIALFIECSDDAKRTPLHVAVQCDFQDVVAFLVSSKANVNAIDKNGDSALHVASKYGRLELVRFLIESKANPNLINSSKQTPLYVAIMSGHLDVVKCLSNISLDILRINHNKKSVLDAAVKSGNVELVKYLMKQFSDASNSAILCAAEKKQTEIFKVLLAHGADPSTRDSVTGEKDGKYELDTSGTNIVFKTLGGKIRERLFYVRGRSNSDESSTSN
ncbi:ion channel nompc [Culex quinquefasciatus]|uniref:Ion channel nompc n=1 Tax=Culex quinquefasciatus TaxID=7176 RepID=B0XH21_CULQU|nr:ion channel nompc [Culex quinquefasciatus]|eukprot:XP_001868943.1 ion channel nompc [Culex quinquefasciatus]